jgi:hypothetical protein
MKGKAHGSAQPQEDLDETAERGRHVACFFLLVNRHNVNGQRISNARV